MTTTIQPDDYPGEVAFDIRVTCKPESMARVLDYLESPTSTKQIGYRVDYLPGEGLLDQRGPLGQGD